LNKSIGKRKMALFLWTETGPPKLETGASFSFSPLMAHQPIPAITSDEVGQGVVGEEAWIKGNRWRVV
jgi:hypothetical protein